MLPQQRITMEAINESFDEIKAASLDVSIDRELLSKLRDPVSNVTFKRMLMQQIDGLMKGAISPSVQLTLEHYFAREIEVANLKKDHNEHRLKMWQEVLHMVGALAANDLEKGLESLKTFFHMSADYGIAYIFDAHMSKILGLIISKTAEHFGEIYKREPSTLIEIYGFTMATLMSLAYDEQVSQCGPEAILVQWIEKDLLRKLNQHPRQKKPLDAEGWVTILEWGYALAKSLMDKDGFGMRKEDHFEMLFLSSYLDLCCTYSISSGGLRKALMEAIMPTGRIPPGASQNWDPFAKYFPRYDAFILLADYCEQVEGNKLKARALRAIYDIVTINQCGGLDAIEKEKELYRWRKVAHQHNDQELLTIFKKLCDIVNTENIPNLTRPNFAPIAFPKRPLSSTTTTSGHNKRLQADASRFAFEGAVKAVEKALLEKNEKLEQKEEKENLVRPQQANS